MNAGKQKRNELSDFYDKLKIQIILSKPQITLNYRPL